MQGEKNMQLKLKQETEQTSTKFFNPDEAAWVVQAQQGDSASFTNIVWAYQNPIYNLCYRMLGNSAEAEDATQEVFIRAYFKLHSYDSNRKFSSWLFSIASHYCIDTLRKRRIKSISWEDLPPWRWLPADSEAQPESVLLTDEANREVHALLNTLPPDYRAAIILRYWHNMPYEEIAKSLDTTVSAIKSRLFRARKMLANSARKNHSQVSLMNNMAFAK
ncbi:MAG: hypothetical protein B6242_06095 [Anaerolineaceae bacterium 4572_78]|nr:MAG: hypothetical protein B6242_06095 [Anaerolineaceae bacterium 4572_78]